MTDNREGANDWRKLRRRPLGPFYLTREITELGDLVADAGGRSGRVEKIYSIIDGIIQVRWFDTDTLCDVRVDGLKKTGEAVNETPEDPDNPEAWRDIVARGGYWNGERYIEMRHVPAITFAEMVKQMDTLGGYWGIDGWNKLDPLTPEEQEEHDREWYEFYEDWGGLSDLPGHVADRVAMLRKRFEPSRFDPWKDALLAPFRAIAERWH